MSAPVKCPYRSCNGGNCPCGNCHGQGWTLEEDPSGATETLWGEVVVPLMIEMYCAHCPKGRRMREIGA